MSSLWNQCTDTSWWGGRPMCLRVATQPRMSLYHQSLLRLGFDAVLLAALFDSA